MNNGISKTIVLATVTARYTHTAIGLRWLYANMGPWQDQTVVREFVLGTPPLQIVESILSHHPRIVGLGVYIWNIDVLTQVGKALKAIRPDITLVLGGPEISYEYEKEPLFHAADYLICGEAERAFPELTKRILNGEIIGEKVISADCPPLETLQLPYRTYTDEDIAKRIIYVESTRGCPFRCAFCLSSREPALRTFPEPALMSELHLLIMRGVKRFTFVDRTFNLDETHVKPLLRFFLDHWTDGMQLHLEILPDRLTKNMIDVLAQFPEKALYLEAGIQTTTPEVLEAIARYQDVAQSLTNLGVVLKQTRAEVHIDLVAGLPHETINTFRDAFNHVFSLRPRVIQLGILKRLKGTAIASETYAKTLTFADYPPYELLQSAWIPFEQMQQLKRMARYLDLFYNSGNFARSINLLASSGDTPFDAFNEFSSFLWNATGRTHEFSLATLHRFLYEYLMLRKRDSAHEIMDAIEKDYHQRPGRKEKLHLPS